jgi:transposase
MGKQIRHPGQCEHHEPGDQAGQLYAKKKTDGELPNATSSKVRQAIEARGCQLLFLPAYSPDLSPIEEAFSKLKAVLRRVGARTREDLCQAISHALELITPQDALGWFTHCGYFPTVGKAS